MQRRGLAVVVVFDGRIALDVLAQTHRLKGHVGAVHMREDHTGRRARGGSILLVGGDLAEESGRLHVLGLRSFTVPTPCALMGDLIYV